MILRAALPAVVLLCAQPCLAREGAPSAPGIPEKKLAALEMALSEAGRASSALRKRRGYKSVFREGEDLLEASPAAPNRWRVLGVMFQSQKFLLGMENDRRNREALMETCGRLSKAPDEYAELRLEADMLLSERELSRRKADVRERAEVLAEMIARYRDTPGEAKSLMMAALIAPKLEAFELEEEIERILGARFAGDLEVIEWRRKHRDFSHLPVQFAGTFVRTDGTALSFPVDRMGHTCVISFWSQATPGIAEHFDEIRELQRRFPGQFEVYSFNLDELPDAGEGILRARGLDWIALRLPGGRKSQVYRAYAQQDPLAVRVNAHGHAFISASQTRVIAEEAPMEQNFDELRYHAQLQSLLVGEFLVSGEGAQGGSVAEETLDPIRACFVAPPMRYRLTRSEALENYRRAEQLCREAIARDPEAPDLWRVRNHRIIALLGMWNLDAGPQHLQRAVEEAQGMLSADLPRDARIVARFCLAKNALRRGDSNPRVLLARWVEEAGGGDAPAAAWAAAAILAMDASAGELHDAYRQKVLGHHGSDPALWPVVSFLVDQNHRYRLCKPNLYLPPSKGRRIERARLRGNAVAFDPSEFMAEPLSAEFVTLTGGALSLPEATEGKLTLLMFVEPPSGSGLEFPALINGETKEDARGRAIETKGVMQQVFEFADQHVRDGIKVIPAFLSDDAGRVKALVEAHQWPGQAVMVPGGLGNPLVRRLGILSADRVPNIVLLHPDGTMAWKLSGIVHPQVRSEGTGETLHVITRAVKSYIETHEMERALQAFENGDLQEAIVLFGGWLPPAERPGLDDWTAPRLHGRALAQMKLKKWEAALADLDAAIVAHQWAFNSKRPCPCAQIARLQRTKAEVLVELGRGEEAKEMRSQAEAAKNSHGPSRAGRLHERLEEGRAKKDTEAGRAGS